MKRVWALLVAVVLALGMGTGALAATPKIIGLARPLDYNGIVMTSTKDTSAIVYGDTWKIPLTADMFDWSDGMPTSNLLTSAQQTAGKLKVTTASKPTCVDTVTLTRGSVTGIGTTTYIQVKFKTTASSSAQQSLGNFKVTLTTNNERGGTTAWSQYALGFSGTMQASNENWIPNDTKEVDISDGAYYYADGNNSRVELHLGEGVTLRTNLVNGKRYKGTATSDDSSETNSFYDKYGDTYITTIKLSTTGFTTSGNIININYSGGEKYYVYNGSGKYLGREESYIEYASKYYLMDKRIDMGGGSVTTTSTSSTSSSSTSSVVGGGGWGSASNTTPVGEPVTVAAATQHAQAAVSAGAKYAQLKNASTITAEGLQAMHRISSSLLVHADSMSGNAVKGRLTIVPARAANLQAATVLNLGVYVDTESVAATKAFFEKWFSNKVAVAALAQKTDFGFTVGVAAKVDLTGMDSKNLYFYSYSKATNKYTLIPDTGYFIDTNGYLHFNTPLAGEIVISNGLLKAR